MSQSTRTFVAVAVPKGLRDRLCRLQERLAADAPGVRWLPPEQFHITLAFLGDVGNSDLAQLCRAVEEAAARFAPFDLRLEGLGAFPSATKPRVLWVGATGPGAEALIAVQRIIAEAVNQAGYPPDGRFHPHVTIGRIQPFRGPPLDATPLVERHRSWTPGSFRVTEVIPFSSTLTPEGPIYAPLARANLTSR